MTTTAATPPESQPASATEPRFVREVGQAAQIAAIVEPRIEALGFRLVKVTVSGRNGTTVQIMAERPDGRITVGECEQISRDLAPALDVAEPLPGHYHLEISSPGIDRPLVRASDFANWAGCEARIELSEPIDGRKRLRGTLDGFVDGEVRIELLDRTKDDGATVPDGAPIVLGLPAALIASARLVLTDDLIREDLRRSSRNKHTDADDQDDGAAEEME